VSQVLHFLAIFTAFAWCWYNIWQAVSKGVIWDQSVSFSRDKSLLFFWVSAVVCLFCGLLTTFLLYKIVMDVL
jgi:hypothetical protein